MGFEKECSMKSTSKELNCIAIVNDLSQDEELHYFTCEEILSQIGLRRRQVAILLLCGMSYFAYCSELFVHALLHISIIETWPHLTSQTYSVVMICSNICSLVGGQFWGWMADSAGRKPVFNISLGIASIFGFASAFAPLWSVFIVFRCCESFGVSGVSAIDFLYAIELLPPEYRSRWPTLITFLGSLGVLYLAGLSMGLIDSLGWRWVVGLAAVPFLVVAALRLFVSCESPRYLVSKGREEEAWEVFETLVGGGSDKNTLYTLLGCNAENCRIINEAVLIDSRNIGVRSNSRDLDETPLQGTSDNCQTTTRARLYNAGKITSVNIIDKSGKGRLRMAMSQYFSAVKQTPIIFNKHFRYRTIILSLLWFLQSLGYWGITSFLPSYYKLIGLAPYMTFFVSISVQLLGILLCAYLLAGKHWFQGRQAATKIFVLLQCLFLGLLIILLVSNAPKWCTTTAGMLIYFAIAPIWNILNIYTPENYPTAFRATATSVLSLVGAVPTVIAASISASVLTFSKERVWLYPTVWCIVYFCMFFITLLMRNETDNQPLCDRETDMKGGADVKGQTDVTRQTMSVSSIDTAISALRDIPDGCTKISKYEEETLLGKLRNASMN